MNARFEQVDELEDRFDIVAEADPVQFRLFLYVVPIVDGERRGDGKPEPILIAPASLREFESFEATVRAQQPDRVVDRPKLKRSLTEFRNKRGQVRYNANSRALVLTNTATAKRLKVGYEKIGVTVFLDERISRLPQLTFSPDTPQQQIDRIAKPCIAAFGP